MATIDRQLRLVEAAEGSQALLIRSARLPGEPEPPIVGESYDRAKILEGLASALEEAWPDFPKDPADLKAFLESASERMYAAAEALKDEPDFVPAAGFTRISRDMTFEYVKLEFDDVWGGLETEDLWQCFDAIDATAPIKRLTRAGLTIKLRALGAFILFGTTFRDDEMTAADFFPKDAWKEKRDADVSGILEKELKFANKQVAHITLTRPLPEDIEVYSGSQRPEFERVVKLFSEFNETVDERLVPDWWSGWFTTFRAECESG